MPKQKTVESHDAEPGGADCGRAHAKAPSGKQGPMTNLTDIRGVINAYREAETSQHLCDLCSLVTMLTMCRQAIPAGHTAAAQSSLECLGERGTRRQTRLSGAAGSSPPQQLKRQS